LFFSGLFFCLKSFKSLRHSTVSGWVSKDQVWSEYLKLLHFCLQLMVSSRPWHHLSEREAYYVSVWPAVCLCCPRMKNVLLNFERVLKSRKTCDRDYMFHTKFKIFAIYKILCNSWLHPHISCHKSVTPRSLFLKYYIVVILWVSLEYQWL
jgi:hypothetical protein